MGGDFLPRWDEVEKEGQAVSEERTLILEMLTSGRVTVEQADQLLEALDSASTAGSREPVTGTGGWQRREGERADGYGASLTPAQLIELRNHDVSGAFVQQMRAAGQSELSVADLIVLHDHDVTPRFVRDLREAGFAELTRDDLIALRNHDIDAAFLREMRSVGLAAASPAQLIALHDHGVDATFVREIRDLGFDNLDPDALIEMYNHGVDGDFVRAMRGPSGRGEWKGSGE